MGPRLREISARQLLSKTDPHFGPSQYVCVCVYVCERGWRWLWLLAVNKEFEEERKEGRRPRPISSSAIPSKGREGGREISFKNRTISKEEGKCWRENKYAVRTRIHANESAVIDGRIGKGSNHFCNRGCHSLLKAPLLFGEIHC